MARIRGAFRCAVVAAALGLVFAGAGCGISKAERSGGRDLELPADWSEAAEENRGGVVPGWLAEFEDPDLERLVAEALEHNRDLQAAAARLRAVWEGVALARAGRLPQASASLSGSYTETRVEDSAGNLSPAIETKDARAGANLSWEVDLWGRLADLHRAAAEDYRAQAADFRGARLSLAANVARAWYNLIAARQQLKLARETLDSFERNHRIIERNYKAGDPTVRSLDVNFSRNQVASAARSVLIRELARDDARRTLEVLLGRYPAAELEGRDDLPSVTRPVPAGLPSELLVRRPDLQEAAARLRASAERASAAWKALLPSVVLTAGGSTTVPSLDLIDLVSDPASVAWNVAGSLAQPVFQGGALTAQARRAEAFNGEAVASFSATALRAFREVESALAREHSLAAQEEFLRTELEQANLAEAQAYRDYSQGIVGILSVLEAQRRAVNARSSMIAFQNERLQNRIDLYLALGGEFEPPAGVLTGKPPAALPERMEN